MLCTSECYMIVDMYLKKCWTDIYGIVLHHLAQSNKLFRSDRPADLNEKNIYIYYNKNHTNTCYYSQNKPQHQWS